jgi:hypothetical protein
MSLRSSLSFSLASLLAFGLLAVAAGACGSGDAVTCDANGANCQICDAYGCRPATSDQTGTGGAGGATTSTTGSGGSTGGTGGAAPCDPTQTTCPCDANGACPDMKACVMGLCLDGCTFSYECGPGKLCFDGACVPQCDATRPCDAGYVCNNGACVVDPTNPACDGTHPCAAGQICVSGLCTTGCNTNADCAAGQICDGASHACVVDTSPKPLCDATHPCPAPQVCEADGYCHYPCAALNDCTIHDNRFVACDQGMCKTQEEVAPECTLELPCPAGQNCISNKCQ